MRPPVRVEHNRYYGFVFISSRPLTTRIGGGLGGVGGEGFFVSFFFESLILTSFLGWWARGTARPWAAWL